MQNIFFNFYFQKSAKGVSRSNDACTSESAINFENTVDGDRPETLMATLLQNEINLQVSK